MKRVLSLMLVVISLLCLSSCGKDDEVAVKPGDNSKPNNSQSQADTTKPSVDEKPTGNDRPTIPMGEALADFTISIFGTVVQFPCKLQDFIDLGWLPGFADNLDDAQKFDRIISGGDMCNLVLYNGSRDVKIFALIYNPGKSDIHYLEGTVRGAYKESGSTAEIKIPGGLILKDDLTPDELIAALGDDYSNREHSEVYTYTCKGGHYTFDFSYDKLYWQIETSKKK